MATTKKPRQRQGRDVKRGCNQAWGGVLRGAAMRLRNLRLQPKAAAAPNRGQRARNNFWLWCAKDHLD